MFAIALCALVAPSSPRLQTAENRGTEAAFTSAQTPVAADCAVQQSDTPTGSDKIRDKKNNLSDEGCFFSAVKLSEISSKPLGKFYVGFLSSPENTSGASAIQSRGSEHRAVRLSALLV